VDLDGDGRRDILSGSYSLQQPEMNGHGVFQVLYGKEDGRFRQAEVLKGTNGKPLVIPPKGEPTNENTCTRPFAVDWNGDGYLDLVVGNFAGTFYLFKGQGKGRFLPEAEEIKAHGQPLSIYYHSDPFVVDWDGDGDLDLLSGSYEGGVQWAENYAGPRRSPLLKNFRWLIERGRWLGKGQLLRDGDLKGPLSCTRIWVDDVNSDGKLDILVGDLVPLVSPADKVTEGEFTRKLADWKKAIAKASKERASAGNDPKKQDEAYWRFDKIYNQRSEFMREDETGFVWLYLRK
jgi:FG-GAP-like repeat